MLMVLTTMEEKKILIKSPEPDLSDHTNPIFVKIRSTMVLTLRGHWETFKHTFTKVRNCCSTFIAGVCLLLLILSLLALALKPSHKYIHVVLIDTQEPPVHVTSRRFLSMALDSSLIAEDFKNFNMEDPTLHKLMSALSPGYLRIGGTMADRLFFEPDGLHRFKTSAITTLDGGECSYAGINCNNHILPNFTMSGDEWLRINKLAAKTGLTLLFDLNCLIRNDDGSWNSSNAEKLIAFSNEHYLNVNWELGNEPNSFKHLFNYEITATQLADDFIKLRQILNKYPLYRRSLLVGPDTTRPHAVAQNPVMYLKSFLQKAGDFINATTWHQYYIDGRIATYLDFINPTIFNVLKQQIEMIYEAVKTSPARNKPIWLGETASAYGGGAPGYSDRFIASFIWLDKLGVAAESGLDVVIRQSLFKGYYALLYEDLTPSPDYWVSALYKYLVGPIVVPCYHTASSLVRLYCQCSKRKTLGIDIPTVTVFGINMKSSEAKVRLEGLLPITEYPYSQKVLAYVLTSNLNLLSKVILLNGEALNVLPNGELPPFNSRIVDSQPYLVMPPYSLVFWVIPCPTLYYCL